MIWPAARAAETAIFRVGVITVWLSVKAQRLPDGQSLVSHLYRLRQYQLSNAVVDDIRRGIKWNLDMSIIESKIVLVETSHPGNIGAAARAMKTMQLSNLALVNPGDLHDPSARARATRAYDILDQAQIFSSLEDAIADCQHVIGVTARTRANAAKAFTPRVLLENLSEQKEALRVAWVFGRERNGLTNEEIDLCHSVCTIPANPDFSSLNIASAVQIICYEAYCRGLESETSDHQQPTAIAASQKLSF